jgi:peptide-methionine (S)-S-oxide reductase
MREVNRTRPICGGPAADLRLAFPAMEGPPLHAVLGTPLNPPFPSGSDLALFGMGCFWGAERVLWQVPGVLSTTAGYAAPADGGTEIEVVRVVFDPERVAYADLLRVFWEAHDPTQGDRQGEDVGPQYRSALLTHGDEQHAQALDSRDTYGAALTAAGHPPITTLIAAAGDFHPADEHHQQYLARHPEQSCDLAGTGVSCPVGLGIAAG